MELGDLEYQRQRELQTFINNYDTYVDSHFNNEIPSNLKDAITQFDDLYDDSHLGAFIFCLDTFKPIRFSKNFSKLIGLDTETVLSYHTFGLFKYLYWKHISFPMATILWRSDFWGGVSNNGPIGTVSYLCGVKFRDKNDVYSSWFARTKYFPTENPKQRYLLVLAQNVSHLLKSDTYWGMHRTPNWERQAFYNSLNVKQKLPYLFSPRELDVLKLVQNMKNNTEISEELNISPFTVQQHRKNMLKRTGAKDTTALVHLAKLCNVL